MINDEISKLLTFSAKWNDDGNNNNNNNNNNGNNHNDSPNDYKIYFQFNDSQPRLFAEGLNENMQFVMIMDPRMNMDGEPFIEFRDGNNYFRLLCKKN